MGRTHGRSPQLASTNMAAAHAGNLIGAHDFRSRYANVVRAEVVFRGNSRTMESGGGLQSSAPAPNAAATTRGELGLQDDLR